MVFSIYKLNKNDTLTNILLFLILTLTIGYLTEKKYEAIIFLYIFAVVIYLLSKNVALSLGLSIVFTNLLITLNYFKTVENFETKKKTLNNKKQKKVGLNNKKLKKE